MHPVIATDTVMDIIPRLVSNDTTIFTGGVIDFVDACFADPSKVPLATKWAWIGGVAAQVCRMVLVKASAN
jgi:hypothetical protein